MTGSDARRWRELAVADALPSAHGRWPQPRPGLRHACPVCRAPTLRQRGAYEVCQVCWWEDDGVVDEGWPSGCNGRTLLEARRHFADGLMSCARSEERYAQFGGGNAELETLKRQVLTCAAGLRLLDDGPDFAACRRRLDGLLAELEAATAAWLRRSEQAGG